MKEPDRNNDSHRYGAIDDQEDSNPTIEGRIPHLAAIISPASASYDSQSPTAQGHRPPWPVLVKLKIEEVASLFNSPASHFCLAAFFVKRVAFASEGFVFQYASEKFLWPLHQTTWLRTAAACGAVVATLIACPATFSFFKAQGFAAHKLDLNTLRISLMILLLSFFCAWKASSGLVLILGMFKKSPPL